MAKKKKSRFAPLAMSASLGSGINLLKNSGLKLCLLLGGLLFIWLAVSIKHDVRSDARFLLANWYLQPGRLPAWVTPEIRSRIMEDFSLGKSDLSLFDQGVLSSLKEALEQSHWIREVLDIRLVYPTPQAEGAVRAAMVLSTPVAMVRVGPNCYLSDSRGRRLGEPYKASARSWFNVPIIEGARSGIAVPKPGYPWRSPAVVDGLSVAAELGRARISEYYPENSIESIDISNARGRVDRSKSEIVLRSGQLRLEWGRAATSGAHRVLTDAKKIANLRTVLTEPHYWRLTDLTLHTPRITGRVRSDSEEAESRY